MNPFPVRSLMLLLTSIGLIALPYLLHNPLLVSVCGCIGVVGSYRVHAGLMSYPGTVIKACLIVLVAILIWLTRGTYLGLDVALDILIATCFLKLLELKSHRHALIQVFLVFVTLAGAFLLSQQLGWVALMCLALAFLLAAWISLFLDQLDSVKRLLKEASLAFLVSVPLMLIAFVVVPRFEPFWSLPNLSKEAVTGVSDSMRPGDFDQLVESNDLAFRIEFQSEMPPRSDWYWRVLTLENFDGTEWTQGVRSNPKPGLSKLTVWPENAFHYQIVLEPTENVWLPHMPQLLSASTGSFYRGHDELVSDESLFKRISYQLVSWSVPKRRKEAPEAFVDRFTALPQASNPRSQRYARELRASLPSDSVFAKRLMSMFREDDFYYSHTPPKTGQHGVDDFLFETREGLCEHYSQAMAVMLRAAGIPSRIVVGYQGGEINQHGGFVQVRQKQAHAWVEAWIEGRWQRYDPTFAVPPDRVKLKRFQPNPFIEAISQRMDQVNFFWQKKVLEFDNRLQKSLLKMLLGEASPVRVAGLILGGFAGVAVLVLLIGWVRRPVISSAPEQRAYQKLLQRLQVRSVVSSNTIPPQALKQIVEQSDQLTPLQKSRCMVALNRLASALYHPDKKVDEAVIKSLHQAIRSL